MTIDPKELKWWLEQYPNLDKEDIIDLLEEMIEESDDATGFSDYLQQEESNDLSKSLRNIIQK